MHRIEEIMREKDRAAVRLVETAVRGRPVFDRNMRPGSGRPGDCRRCGSPYRLVPMGAIPTCGCYPVRLAVTPEGVIYAEDGA